MSRATLVCPFCGNALVLLEHNVTLDITFVLCGDDWGRGGCGAVVSFRPRLTGTDTLEAYNRRVPHVAS